MTVAELIDLLRGQNPDALVLRRQDDLPGATVIEPEEVEALIVASTLDRPDLLFPTDEAHCDARPAVIIG